MALPPIPLDDEPLLDKICQLEPLPAVLMELIAAVQTPDAKIDRIADLVENEVCMSARVLSTINSTYYALPGKITSIRYAVSYLGMGEVYRIALSQSVVQSLAPTDPESLREFSFHSYLTALISKRVVRVIAKPPKAEEVYVAALLHDMGKLVYSRWFPEHAREIQRFSEENRLSHSASENALGLPSHGELGVKVCEHWRLPASIARACEFHELEHLQGLVDLDQADPSDVVVCASNALANLMEPDVLAGKSELSAELQRVLALDHDSFSNFLDGVQASRLIAEQSVSQFGGIA
ncbi:MAG: HDOD domain-containing protein [Polyangiaceae bacterium]|nr:HDOD domain-containing protein [Polyangiaceae bacterium]